MSAVKRFLSGHRIFFGLFAFLLVYEAVIGNALAPWRVNDHFFVFFTVDFSLGFCTKLLPGAVYRMIFKESDYNTATVCSVILLVLFFISLCVFLEKLIKRTDERDRSICLFAVLLFITGPASFSLFVSWLGVIDVYWILISMLVFICMTKKQLWFLIPPLLVACVFVHYGAMICYIPMMLIMLLIKLTHCEDKKDRRLLWTVFCLGAALSAGFTLYFMINEHSNLVYPDEEFDRIVKERGAKYTYYYDYNFYKNITDESGKVIGDYINEGSRISSVIRTVAAQIKVTLALRLKADSLREFIVGIIALLPAAACMASVFLKRAFDKTAPVLQRIVCALPPLLFVGSFVLSMLFSSDDFRWLTHAFLPLAAAFMYYAYHEGEKVWRPLRERLPCAPCLAVYYILYAALAFSA
ncbi:MAG: hypothetical protein IJS90_10065 [Clostridia bacterium]|nr:hypothetical protein [Clostridia bacterium]